MRCSLALVPAVLGVLAVFAVFAGPGCAHGAGAELDLDLPGADGPGDARVEAYRGLAPRDPDVPGATALVLRGGQVLEAPQDVLQIVDPRSTSAFEATRADGLSRTGARDTAYGIIAGALSAAPFAYAAVAPSTGGGALSSAGRGSVIALGIVVLGLGTVELVHGLGELGEARAALVKALETYDEGLRARLNVCPPRREPSGGAIYPCEERLRPVLPDAR